ncbi:MAG: hypothetical protein AAGC77_02970 [Pseudomonadota bacterium]
MSYAPNDPYSLQGGGAAVGLLARKGQACPAVDAAAHEGVDFAFSAAASQGQAAYAIPPEPDDHLMNAQDEEPHQSTSAAFAAAPVVDAVFEPAESPPAPANSNAPGDGVSAAVLYLPAPARTNRDIDVGDAVKPNLSLDDTGAAPETVREAGPTDAPAPEAKPKERRSKTGGGGDGSATVALRVSKSDLKRIKELAEDFGISPRAVIADALECYLQANEDL